jgi:hypothetical protein
VRSRKSGAFGFEALGINFEDRHETIVVSCSTLLIIMKIELLVLV